MGQPIGIIRHSEEVDELIDPELDCEIDSIISDEEDSAPVTPRTPDVTEEDETETIELETKGYYVLEVVKGLYHAGMHIYRMKSIRNFSKSN